MDLPALRDRLRSLHPALAAKGVTHLAIYGSRARGDHRQESDLDILIEVDEDRIFSLLDLIGVQHVVEDDVGITVSAAMRRSLPTAFQHAIGKDLVEVF